MPKIKLKRGSAEFDDNQAKIKTVIRRCEMPGCHSEAGYRAPKGRDLSDYYHFCLEHVQEYNRAWDYFSGMSAIEIENYIAKSMYGDRPTWKYGVNGDIHRILEDRAWQSYHFTDQEKPAFEGKENYTHYQNSPEFEAMAIMGLKPPLGLKEIKARYKVLVKMYHPDHNPNDPKAEETLKSINMAYTILKLAYDKFEKITK
jgi:hypothetical protein